MAETTDEERAELDKRDLRRIFEAISGATDGRVRPDKVRRLLEQWVRDTTKATPED